MIDFKGKKITVMGIGLLGGIGDIIFLAKQGAELIVTDLKTEEEAKEGVEILREFPHITFTLGRHDIEDFRNRDVIIKAPSTPLDSAFIAEARKNGIRITMWAALFSRAAKEAGATIVGVTGTRGKTTTTSIIAHTLRVAGTQVIEGGNLRGTSLLSRLSDLTAESIVVLELDSWKLQGFGEEKISPDVAVFTCFLDDHLNYYRSTSLTASRELYFADKAYIYRNQDSDDTLVVGEDMAEMVKDAPSKVVVAKRDSVPAGWNLQIRGNHNLLNVVCAIEALRALQLSEEEVKKGIESFTGVPGRLEKIAIIRGVDIYNDTTATTPDATIAALNALAPKPVILVMGGADKNLDMAKLVEALPGATKKVILLPGTGSTRLVSDYELMARDIERVETLSDALEIALASAREGDAILLSPAFASFGQFRNEYDRGDQWNALVKGLN